MSGPSTTHNWLIISDLHLGEDLHPGAITGDHVDRAEEGLVSFLTYYTASRLDDRPWKLIVNGDMVDFLSVCLLPADEGLLTALHPDDHTWGLGTNARASRAKMRRVLTRHERVFGALAAFLAAGNEVAVVLGNHDAEFYWPEVQDTFRQGLRALSTAPDVDAGLTFHPWFFFEEDQVWVEHGHQYDPYCSFDAVLQPTTPGDEEIDLNVGATVMHYLQNHYRPHSGGTELGFWEYIGWLLRQGAGRGLGVLGSFAAANRRLLTVWWTRTPEAIRAMRERHLRRLHTLADRSRVSEDALLRLDALRDRPSTLELARLLRAMMLDRLMTTLGGMMLWVLALLYVPWAWMPVVTAALLLGGLVAYRRLESARESIFPQRRMAVVARKIRGLVRAPIVVFGHAHEAVAERHEDGGWYFNTGTWVAEGREAVKRAFTHLRIRRTPDGPRAELCQWRKGRSLAFRPARVR